MLKLQQNPDVDASSIDLSSEKQTALDVLKTQIVDQQGRIASLRERYRDDSPEVQNAVSRRWPRCRRCCARRSSGGIEIARQRIALQKSRVDGARPRHRQTSTRGWASSRTNQRRVDELEAELKTLRMRYDEYAKARDRPASARTCRRR